MIAIVAIGGLLFLVLAVVGIFYFAGNRGRAQEVADREAAAKGHNQTLPHEPNRTSGQGDL